MKFLTSGKVKDIYAVDEETILFKFSDRVSAYDVKFKQDIPRKGEVLCKFAEFWFNKLSVPNHFVQRESIHSLPKARPGRDLAADPNSVSATAGA